MFHLSRDDHGSASQSNLDHAFLTLDLIYSCNFWLVLRYIQRKYYNESMPGTIYSSY
jgi:hypothetical protein